jgi:hypothetical protein
VTIDWQTPEGRTIICQAFPPLIDDPHLSALNEITNKTIADALSSHPTQDIPGIVNTLETLFTSKDSLFTDYLPFSKASLIEALLKNPASDIKNVVEILNNVLPTMEEESRHAIAIALAGRKKSEILEIAQAFKTTFDSYKGNPSRNILISALPKWSVEQISTLPEEALATLGALTLGFTRLFLTKIMDALAVHPAAEIPKFIDALHKATPHNSDAFFLIR